MEVEEMGVECAGCVGCFACSVCGVCLLSPALAGGTIAASVGTVASLAE